MSDEADTQTLPDRIRAARKAAGFPSQEAFAHALGTSRIHVNAWETGRNAPSYAYAVKIAEQLGGEPEHWMAQDGHGPRRRDEALAQRLEQLAGEMAETNRQILGLLTEIRNAIVRPVPPAGDGSR